MAVQSSNKKAFAFICVVSVLIAFIIAPSSILGFPSLVRKELKSGAIDYNVLLNQKRPELLPDENDVLTYNSEGVWRYELPRKKGRYLVACLDPETLENITRGSAFAALNNQYPPEETGIVGVEKRTGLRVKFFKHTLPAVKTFRKFTRPTRTNKRRIAQARRDVKQADSFKNELGERVVTLVGYLREDGYYFLTSSPDTVLDDVSVFAEPDVFKMLRRKQKFILHIFPASVYNNTSQITSPTVVQAPVNWEKDGKEIVFTRNDLTKFQTTICVVNKYRRLVHRLRLRHIDAVLLEVLDPVTPAAPSPEPSPNPSKDPEPEPSPSASPVPSPSPAASPSPSPSASPVPSPSPAASPVPSPSPAASPVPSPSPAVSPVPSPSPAASPVPSPSPSPSP